MEGHNNRIRFLGALFVFIVLFFGCDSTSNMHDFSEVTMTKYYQIEDFQSITVGESTFRDVYKIAPAESLQITSYGGICEYPMQNGGYVRIKFLGQKLIVGAIEEISKTPEKTGMAD